MTLAACASAHAASQRAPGLLAGAIAMNNRQTLSVHAQAWHAGTHTRTLHRRLLLDEKRGAGGRVECIYRGVCVCDGVHD